MPRSGKQRSGKPRKEWCILIVHEDEKGNVSLQEPPALMRTSAKRKFNWLVFGECDDERGCQNDYKIEIGPFKKDGQTLDIFSSEDLKDDVPKSQDEAAHLKAKLKKKNELEKGTYTYTITVSTRRSAKRRAKLSAQGMIDVCPVWPCD